MKRTRVDWLAWLQPQRIGLIVTVLIIVLAILLAVQYQRFLVATENLVALQQEYRGYISVLKQIATDTAQHSVEPAATTPSSEEKKKDFLVVNRTARYLKQSLVRYLQEKGPAININEIEDLYRSYTSQQLDKLHAKKTGRKVVRRRRQRRYTALRTSEEIAPEPRIEVSRDAVSDFQVQWPIARGKCWLSSFFGQRRNSFTKRWEFHRGLDLAAPKGTRVTAAQEGSVIVAGYVRGYGNTVVLQHSMKYKTRYAHLDSITVHLGDFVTQGELVGTVGNTGSVRSRGQDGSHLHFEVYMYGRQINPLLVLR